MTIVTLPIVHTHSISSAQPLERVPENNNQLQGEPTLEKMRELCSVSHDAARVFHRRCLPV